MKTLLALSVCLLAQAATAQIAMSAYVRTFTANAVRGFYFQAPGTMVVTGLMVPDEKKIKGQKQVVAIYKLKAAPPAFSQTVTATPVFKNFTTDPGKIIPVIPPVTYQKDDWFVVLGGVGTTSTINNSYGGSQVPSSVLGMPITLRRCGVQTNLQASTTTAIFSEAAGPIARVRVFVGGHGRAEPYGAGSTMTSTPAGELDYSDPFPPSIGKKAEMIFMPGTASNTGALLAVGLQRAAIRTTYGNLLVTPILTILPVGSGALPLAGAPVSFNIPNQTAITGVKVTFQGAVGLTGGLTLTNGREWTIGR